MADAIKSDDESDTFEGKNDAVESGSQPADSWETAIALGSKMGLKGDKLAAFVERQIESEREEARREREKEREEARREKEREDARREKEREEARSEKEEARKELELRLRHEREMKELSLREVEVRGQANAQANQSGSASERVEPMQLRIPRFNEKEDDLDTYLSRFERIAKLQKWGEDTWGVRLGTLLHGKALDVFNGLSDDDASKYETLKQALLLKFKLSAESYRRKLRTARRAEGESFLQHVTKMELWLTRWLKLAKKQETFEDLKDLLLLEQFLGVSPELATFIRERKPASVKAAAEFAEDYAEARKGNKKWVTGNKPAPYVHPNKPQGKPMERSKSAGSERTQGVCYFCNKPGHIRRNCTAWKAEQRKDNLAVVTTAVINLVSTEAVPSLCDTCEEKPLVFNCQALVEGQEVQAWRDTGASMMVVKEALVPKTAYLRTTRQVILADGDAPRDFPTAMIKVESPFYQGQAVAVVMPHPVHSLLIGNEVQDESGRKHQIPVYQPRHYQAAVQTRGQQKREGKPANEIETETFGGRIQLQEEQRKDPTLSKLRELAERGETKIGKSGTVAFSWRKGTLTRVYKSKEKEYKQVVVPASRRLLIMQTAHDVPLAGHMGAKHTMERVWKLYYWPGMNTEVRRFCASCIQCRRTVPRGRNRKVPLGSMPLMGEPFQRVAIDLVERTKEKEPVTFVKIALVMEDEEEQGSEQIPTANIPLPVLQAEESLEDVNIDPLLPTQQRKEVKQICKLREKCLTDLPKQTDLDTFGFTLFESKPVFVHQYPLPLAAVETVKKEVEDMLRIGVIEPAASPYNAPIVLVKKKDGKIRFCVDYRKLNLNTVFDGEPLPDVEYLFSQLSKGKYYSKIDLSKGYWQIKVREEDRPKTAFTTPRGQFQWKVMPFGLKNAVAVFSRMMRKLLEPLKRKDITNFMDDILVVNETWKEHLEALKVVLDRLIECNLSARPSKCYFGYRELNYLGHLVGGGYMKPEEEKVAKIKSAARPTSKKEVRSFLGLAGYYRKFVPNFSTIALPLTELTKNRQPNRVVWNEDCEEAFRILKEKLGQQPIICLPDPQKPFVLRTDASDKGLGAVLLQEKDGELRPVAYASKKLSDTEKNYATVEKECYGVIWGVKKFEPYLYGQEFVLETDHQSLQYLHRSKLTNGRLMRWSLLLQPFSFRVRVIPGKENVGADFLSRSAAESDGIKQKV